MQINNMNFLVGADPELFIGKGGKPHSAYGLIAGDKRCPEKVKDGAVQVDGMALEFNIDPADTKEEFVSRIQSVQEIILSMTPGFELIPAASVFFDAEHFAQQPFEARQLGCEPDYSGITGRENRKPNGDSTMRTAGGHLHIGGFESDEIYGDRHFSTCCRLARIMDEEVGVYSVLFDHDDLRRSMYGAPATFRPKTYGMEYRTMSNAWIFNPKIAGLMYEFTLDAIERMFDPTSEVDPVVHEILANSDRGHKFFRGNRKAKRIMEACA